MQYVENSFLSKHDLLLTVTLCGLLVTSGNLQLLPHRTLEAGLALWTKSLWVFSLSQKGRGVGGGHAGAEERQGKKDILGTDRMNAQGD